MNSRIIKKTRLEILLISDLHYDVRGKGFDPVQDEVTHLGPELITRCVNRLRRSIEPDLIVLPGDLLENGDSEGAEENLREIRARLDCLGIPCIAIPGNHDADAQRFLRVFETPPGGRIINGYNIFTFFDSYDSDNRCFRNPEDMRRFEEAAGRHPDKPILVFQHAPIYPPIDSDYPYVIQGAEEITQSYSKLKVLLSVSGHYHPGQPLTYKDGVGYVTAKGILAVPYQFMHISLRAGTFEVREIPLRMQETCRLFDFHIHTEFAYCRDDITAEGAIERAKTFGLSAVALTEHAGQLYVEKEDYSSGKFLEGRAFLKRSVASGKSRMKRYREFVDSLKGPFVRAGIEVELGSDGKLTLLEEDEDCWFVTIGAVHFLPGTGAGRREAAAAFMKTTEGLCNENIDVLAHPFRYFIRSNLEVPEELFKPMARLLAERKVAAELNYHTNRPDVRFFELCLEEGVKIALGSDAHYLEEVGEFTPHLELLRQAGAVENLEKVLFAPTL